MYKYVILRLEIREVKQFEYFDERRKGRYESEKE